MTQKYMIQKYRDSEIEYAQNKEEIIAQKITRYLRPAVLIGSMIAASVFVYKGYNMAINKGEEIIKSEAHKHSLEQKKTLDTLPAKKQFAYDQ